MYQLSKEIYLLWFPFLPQYTATTRNDIMVLYVHNCKDITAAKICKSGPQWFITQNSLFCDCPPSRSREQIVEDGTYIIFH